MKEILVGHVKKYRSFYLWCMGKIGMIDKVSADGTFRDSNKTVYRVPNTNQRYKVKRGTGKGKARKWKVKKPFKLNQQFCNDIGQVMSMLFSQSHGADLDQAREIAERVNVFPSKKGAYYSDVCCGERKRIIKVFATAFKLLIVFFF